MSRERPRPVPISVRTRGARTDRAVLRRLVRGCLDAEKAPRAQGAGLVLAGDRLVRRLNREWRGMDRTTDVLAFPTDDVLPLPPDAGEEDSSILGEVIVSIPKCRLQAQDAGTSAGEELVRLIVHGLLHLLGHDHLRAEDARIMRRRERALRAWAGREGIGSCLLRNPARAPEAGAPRCGGAS